MRAEFRETTQEMAQHPEASTHREPSPPDIKRTVYGNWRESCLGRATGQELWLL